MQGRMWRRLGGSAGTVLVLGLTGGASPARAEVSCKLNVVPSVSSPYAAAYDSSMRVRVRSKEGRTLSGLKVELYTFSGRRLAIGTRRGRIGGEGSATVRVRLRYPMQAGKLTLVVSELRGASCGTPKGTKILTLRGCPGAIPARLTRFSALVPGEQRFSDVIGATGGAFLRDITSRLYDPAGALVGQTSLDVLFGRQTLDHELAAPLVSGTYTQVIMARVDGLPPACPSPFTNVAITVP